MIIQNIVAELDAEIARLQQVRRLLVDGSHLNGAKSGGRGKTAAARKVARKKRTLSPEGRRRIADAQRKRWAAQKKGAK